MGSKDVDDFSPSWSPDGEQILFITHSVIAEPGDTYLTAPPSSSGPSDWMPDGSTVALIQDYSERAMLRAVRPYGPEPTERFIVPDGIAEWYEVDGIDVYVPQ